MNNLQRLSTEEQDFAQKQEADMIYDRHFPQPN
jgi:hypothetical protein